MHTVRRALLLTLLFEGLTLVARFGLGLESTRDTASILAPWTLGWRIHHSYVGGLVVVAFLVLVKPRLGAERQALGSWIVAFGLALIVSDLVHHFVVLWLVEGDPQFDLRYPPSQGGWWIWAWWPSRGIGRPYTVQPNASAPSLSQHPGVALDPQHAPRDRIRLGPRPRLGGGSMAGTGTNA